MSGRVTTKEGELGCAELGWGTLSSPRRLKLEATDRDPGMGARLHGAEKTSFPPHPPAVIRAGTGSGGILGKGKKDSRWVERATLPRA